MSEMINPEYINDGPLSEEEEIYKENVIDHYKNPRNVGELEECTFAHSELNPLCGDNIKIFVKLENGKVQDILFKGEGCAVSQASISMLTDFVKGKSIEQIKALGPWDIFNLLGIRISPNRSKCALLSLKTIHEGFKEAKV
jgi:nitrogen fixation protein NifU and related proteins